MSVNRNEERQGNFCGRTRREFLWEAGAGFTSLALGGMLGQGFLANQSLAADGVTAYSSPLAPKSAMIPAKAKSVIFLFMYGGPSHVDTFDYKPALYPLDNKTVEVKTFGRGGTETKAASSAPSGTSGHTDSVENTSVTCFPTWDRWQTT